MHTAHFYNGALYVIGGRHLPKDEPLTKIEFTKDIYKLEFETKETGEGEDKKIERKYYCSEKMEMPDVRAAHCSVQHGKYVIIYSGTNGMKFINNCLRLDLETKQWQKMKMYDDRVQHVFSPEICGRIAVSTAASSNLGMFFGGCSAEKEHNDFWQLELSKIDDDENFEEVD